ncbi:MAG: hypothetical protein H7Y28_03775 [Rhodoferax sp.]|nr:hypothetical protein [Rhodoferax sp.]
MSTSEINLFQIAYDVASREKVSQSGFLLLDNQDNARPDWYEYWPIRNYLLTNTLIESDWYGFFSPKFSDKTQLGYAEVRDFVVTAEDRGASVALFSPQPDMGANFLNVFEQAELFDPGFLETAQAFVASLGLEVPLVSLVMDSRQIVYSNYLVAKPAFWRAWFAWTEAMFVMAEDTAHPFSASLCQPTTYGINAQRKVFLLERLAPLLLTLQPEFKTAEANSFNFGWSMARFRAVPEDSYINDALKRAFRDTGFPQYMTAFRKQREKFTGSS